MKEIEQKNQNIAFIKNGNIFVDETHSTTSNILMEMAFSNHSDTPNWFDNSIDIPPSEDKTELKEEKIDNIDQIDRNLPKKNEEIKENEQKKEEKRCGRKRKGSTRVAKHTDNSEDNMIIKAKTYVKKSLTDFINSKIRSINRENKYRELKDINKDEIISTNVKLNNILFQKKIRDIVTANLSDKFSTFPKEYNKDAIELIEKDENNDVTSVTLILDLTFLECLKYFRKDKDVINDEKYACLAGLEKYYEKYPKYLEGKKKNKEYIDKIISIIQRLEEIYKNKIPRRSRKEKK